MFKLKQLKSSFYFNTAFHHMLSNIILDTFHVTSVMVVLCFKVDYSVVGWPTKLVAAETTKLVLKYYCKCATTFISMHKQIILLCSRCEQQGRWTLWHSSRWRGVRSTVVWGSGRWSVTPSSHMAHLSCFRTGSLTTQTKLWYEIQLLLLKILVIYFYFISTKGKFNL